YANSALTTSPPHTPPLPSTIPPPPPLPASPLTPPHAPVTCPHAMFSTVFLLAFFR
ncbi:unnamed protein product, partial [Closterium sp. NIES-53]